MKNVKELLKERTSVEEKLTQSEIAYNKVSYKSKEILRAIKRLEKENDRSTPEHIESYKKKLSDKEKSLSKYEVKLLDIKEKVYDDKEQKKSLIYNQKLKIKNTKIDIRKLEKKIQKYQSISTGKHDEEIKRKTNTLEILKPEIEKKKETVSKYKKQYKALNKEWKKLFPDEDDSIIFSVKNLNIYYGKKLAIKDVNIDIPKNEVISIIGPSGCGKSTFLKTLNRINDEIPTFKAEGEILFQNEIDILKLQNIHDNSIKMTLPELRTKVGMVFQQPNPFPMSIFNNIAYGPRINGIKNKAVLKEIVDATLKKSALYEQVKDNLNAMATGLSGGQQQRLCIARAIANKPNVLLMDEPTSALDPIAAKVIEDLILELKKDYTIIMVTHSMQQAARISDKTAFFYQGELIEYGNTSDIFKKPKQKMTEDYIKGKFG